jgi:3D (Asp-Asp-Asp) domain-containing protein
MPLMSASAWRPWIRKGRAFLRWWFAALGNRHGWFAAIRLTTTTLGIGILVGWASTRYLRIIAVEEKYLPKPVIEAVSGMRWVAVKTTGYCPCALCCGLFADGKTAINRDVTQFPYGIAVEPKLVPYRLMVDVPGYGTAMVDDTGGAMRQSAKEGIVHFDLRFVTHSEARRWGVRHMYIALPVNIPAAQLPEHP